VVVLILMLWMLSREGLKQREVGSGKRVLLALLSDAVALVSTGERRNRRHLCGITVHIYY
jgi:hypothetical protein